MAIPIMNVTDIEGNIAPSVNVGVLLAPAISDAPIYQTINLYSGWSLISSYIDTTQLVNWDYSTYPNNSSDPYKVSEILKQFLYKLDANNVEYNVWSTSQSEFIANVAIVKDGIGSAYLPQYDFDGVGGLKFTGGGENIAGVFQGLQIKMLDSGYYIKLNGYAPTLLNSETITFPMLNGWSIIGFPSQQPISLTTFLENLPIENINLVKDFEGNAYMPAFDYNGIGNLIPGHGYQVNLYNWTSGNSFVAKIFGQTVPPIEEEVEEDQDDVVIVDNTITYTTTNMTIKIPSNIILEVIDDINTTLTLDTKLDILKRYFATKSYKTTQKNLKELNAAVRIFTEELIVIPEKDKFESDFEVELYNLEIESANHNEPSGYSIKVQDYILNTWDTHKNFKLDGFSLIDLFIIEISKHSISLSFIAYTANKGVFIGRIPFKVVGYKIASANIILTVQGDDSLTSTVEGLASNEVPLIYLFTGEKYLLLSPTLASGNLQYADKKQVSITALNLSKEFSTPL
tara:strand:+ start:15259 stop:16800 length:1542 start_codon:yes stop_codon:yes gene_type:complete